MPSSIRVGHARAKGQGVDKVHYEREKRFQHKLKEQTIMGLFFIQRSTDPNLRPDENGRIEFSWARFAAAAGVLFAILVACIISGLNVPAGNPSINPMLELHRALLHTFEVLAGALAGLITGEAAGIHRQRMP
jgi:hypothetical protein